MISDHDQQLLKIYQMAKDYYLAALTTDQPSCQLLTEYANSLYSLLDLNDPDLRKFARQAIEYYIQPDSENSYAENFLYNLVDIPETLIN